MSVNQHYRSAWVKTVFAQAVDLFHKTRKEKINAEVPLADLARQCANTVFQENAPYIVGDKELCAKDFMAHCREHFLIEINAAIGAQVNAKMAEPQEARAS